MSLKQTSFSSAPVADDDEERSARESIAQAEDDAPSLPIGLPSLITGVSMVVIAVFCFVIAFSVTPEQTVSEADEKEIFALRKEISAAQVARDELPDAQTGERSLVQAHEAAVDIAQMQNSYRSLAVDAAAADGRLEDGQLISGKRDLTPYFDPSTDNALLGPWYLLAADADVEPGTGIPEFFDSGFAWQAQMPADITTAGTVPVTWIAVQTRTAEDAEPATLAWARAEYDITRQVVTDLQIGTTALGEALRQEVR